MQRARWGAVLEHFSRSHEGALAGVVCVQHGSTLSYHTGWYPLAFVRAEKGATGATTIRIGLKGGPTVAVFAPRALGLDTRADRIQHALEVEAPGGEFVRLSFGDHARWAKPRAGQGVRISSHVQRNSPHPCAPTG
ncbi:MAG: hypothetical protein A3F70_09480 [Acidobacteria bacterium RIFCSPLOWO2_12_FULL_67_14]|nr:MAG: hypothetical protein A3F70_09480 [Acidobacteria bacterium RIFCSPLOWO2_12_FULL_67_14]